MYTRYPSKLSPDRWRIIIVTDWKTSRTEETWLRVTDDIFEHIVVNGYIHVQIKVLQNDILGVSADR